MFPFILSTIFGNLSGQLADLVINGCKVSVQNTRKIMQGVTLIVPAILYFLLRFMRGNVILSAITLCVLFGAQAFNRAGTNVNALDLSPNNAGVIYSIVNIFSQIPGIISPLVAGWILDVMPSSQSNTISSSPWDMVFNLIIAVNLFGAVFYTLFARGTAQFR